MALILPQLRAHEAASSASTSKLLLPRTTRPLNAPALVRYWHLASLDAPTVAVVWSLAFAWAAHVQIAAWVVALDVLVVWTVYVADRLLDARRELRRSGLGMRDRHWFHWRHRRVLVPMSAATAVASALIALRWMPATVWARDSIVGVASLAYFARVHSARLRVPLPSKEMLVGVLFTAGCALPAISWSIALPVVFFAALAWLNCWSIDRWESAAQQNSVAKTAAVLAIAGLAIALCIFPIAPRAALLLIAGSASAALLATLDLASSRMTAVTLRASADLVLLSPAVLLVATRVAR